MLKKIIKYVDLDGNEQEESFHFNLSKAELMDMEMSVDGGLSNTIRRISSSGNTKEVYHLFKDILKKAYGVKSPDGKRFVKSDTLWEEFEQSPAYSELFMELVENSDAASAFMNGIIPKM